MPDHGRLNQGQSPLRGVVLCCTAIAAELRSGMAAVAHQMGAVHKLDLTSDVTHLIVGNIDTPKYKYVAKERQDIKVLQPAWLEAVRASWIQGEETDVAALEHQFRLPTFFNLQICVTGFDDFAQRNDILDTVTKHGATYHGDLTKSVTHLIAAAPAGKKFEYAGVWGMKIVTLEWLYDSLERGMSLDENLYHPLLSLEKRGIGAVTQKKIPSPHLGKHPREEIQPAEPGEGSRRKLRRTASTRIESQNDDLWADIGSGDAKQNLAPMADQNQAPPGGEDVSVEIEKRRSATDAGDNLGIERSTELLRNPRAAEASIFSDQSCPVKVFIHGFDDRKTELLHGYLASNGAEVFSEEDKKKSRDSAKIVLPHDSKIGIIDQLFQKNIAHSNDNIVTEWWVEKCLHKKRLVSHEEPLCEPFAKFPIPGFEKLTICPTSFSSIDLLLFSKAVKLIGASYDESLRKETSVLVCHDTSANPDKLRYALENKIPIVSAEWLYESVRRVGVQAFEDYALSTSRQSQKSSHSCFFHPIHNPRPTANPHDSSRHRRDRHGTRATQQRGCLDLTRHPGPHASEQVAGQNARSSSMTNEDVANVPDEPTLPLQNLSPSRQNAQQSESSIHQTVETQHSAADAAAMEEEQRPAAVLNPEPKQSALIRLESLRVSQAEQTERQNETTKPNAAANAPLPAHAGSMTTDLLGPPADPKKQRSDSLDNAIATLKANQQRTSASLQSRPSSASSDPLAAPAIPRRAPRTLGRAPSNGSAALSRTNSLDGRSVVTVAANQTHVASEQPIVDDEILDGAGGGARSKLTGDMDGRGGFRPSQALSYEDPEGAAVREMLMQRLNNAGSDVESFGLDGLDDGKGRGQRVESIGVVKDAGFGEDKRRRGMRRK